MPRGSVAWTARRCGTGCTASMNEAPKGSRTGVLGGRRKTPQLVGRKVHPHRHRCSHGTNPPAPWNQLNIERGIANESEREAVVIKSSLAKREECLQRLDERRIGYLPTAPVVQ